jgi:hypothetical protein
MGNSDRESNMTISKECLLMLKDLVENKLSCMHVADRDDLREMVALQRCLSELQFIGHVPEHAGEELLRDGVMAGFSNVPRRGRRRKTSYIGGQM